MFLNSLNNFRAIAIIIIVAGHCFHISNFEYNSLAGQVVYNLTKGGTALFVFISGFLFHHVFFMNFELKSFLKKKVKFVLFPYLVMAMLPILFLVINENLASTHPQSYFAPAGEGWDQKYAIPFLKYYLTGFRIISYWYIPFILVMFALSPVFIRFLRIPLRSQLAITAVLLIVALFIHRPAYNTAVDVWHSVIYYVPVYLVGMLASIKKKDIYRSLQGKEFYILSACIGLALLQVLFGQIGNSFKDPLVLEGIDLMLPQKLGLCFFFMVWLHRFEDRHWPFLDRVASCSFGIFFIHGPFVGLLNRLQSYGYYQLPEGSFLLYLFNSAIVLLVSLGLTLIVQYLFPRHSRYLVGS
ncbi:acyltransferase [Zeaxanthinibacter sp. PT1]|uniref:acyltransferase family protein n=1 Tax=Zeaxanthinibacter TaxID=561554 RepID=UPI0023496212|nr:acyltransferase [Zeaxanthinibacter sp. PT1]MDC6352361.1 acyltransferase [Zeaxanthinibacter sp. PT1]